MPAGIRTSEVIDLARAAGIAFLEGSALGWSRAQLRLWVILEYETAIAWTRGPEPRADLTLGLDDVQTELLAHRTRTRVVSMLERARELWSEPGFARDMENGGLIVNVRDESGAQAYAPTSHADMGLVHRVTSLFVADYLARPADYEKVAGCEGCGRIAIGTESSHPAWCAEPPSERGVADGHRLGRGYSGRLPQRAFP